MRAAALAAAAALSAGPATAAKPPQPVNPDPFTASGRFELPRAGEGRYAGRVKVGQVRLDPALAARTKLDPEALAVAVRAAAERSLTNFGYAAPADHPEPLLVDLEILPPNLERTEAALSAAVSLRFAPQREDGCLAAVSDGRFRALDRKKSGAGRRAFAVGMGTALAALNPYAPNTFMTGQFDIASAENKALNALRPVAQGEGVSPEFGEVGQTRYAVASAVQLAFADYIRRLGSDAACVSR